jgi:hypothetical protein
MNRKILNLSITSLIFVTACGQTPPLLATPTPTSTDTSIPTSTPTAMPTITPDVFPVDQSAIMFEQNFESGTPEGLSPSGSWTVTTEENGNHAYCNSLTTDYSVVSFGRDQWKDYAVELRVKALEHHEDPYISVFARSNPSQDYYGALNFQNFYADLSLSEPYRSLGHQYFPTTDNKWYRLRLEVAGSSIKFYIDNQLVGEGIDTQLSQGMAGFTTSPDTRMCFDDIRVWALTSDGQIGQAPIPIHVSQAALEIVTDNAATGDGGNAWGGHQTRIVRTNDGVFTAYTVAGSGHFQRTWQLARRQDDGTWPVIAQGDAGKDPVNLLASPDGTIHIIGWPNMRGTMWSGKPSGNTIEMKAEIIPNVSQSNWPYSSAGIDKAGNICVLSSVGGETPGGTFEWACYLPSHGTWITQTTFLDYRYCYTYLFPVPSGSLAIVSTRDVRWSALGYNQPSGQFDYVFNALGYWRTDDLTKDPLKRLYFIEEKPTAQFPVVTLDAQQDAYLDTAGNMHVLYQIQGRSTQGTWILRQLILSPDGQLLKNVQLPEDIGGFARIFQDAGGQFYILGSSGLLYPAGRDGITFGSPIQIDLKGYTVEYSGYGISAPRTGTLPGNVLDVVFPSDNGSKWIYFQINLPGN